MNVHLYIYYYIYIYLCLYIYLHKIKIIIMAICLTTIKNINVFDLFWIELIWISIALFAYFKFCFGGVHSYLIQCDVICIMHACTHICISFVFVYIYCLQIKNNLCYLRWTSKTTNILLINCIICLKSKNNFSKVHKLSRYGN